VLWHRLERLGENHPWPPTAGKFPLSMVAGRDTSLFPNKEEKPMLPLPLPPNPLNPFGIVSSSIAVTATVAGLGVGLALGAAMLAASSMMSRRH
jgi:hypothetical protein